MPKISCLALFIIYSLVGSFSSAASAPAILIDGQIEQAELISFTFNENVGIQAEFKTLSGPIRLDSSRLVRWGNPKSQPKRESIYFQDDSKIFSGEVWTTDDRITIDERLINLHRANGELSFSIDSVKQINLGQVPQDRINNDSTPDTLDEIVHLNNGDQIVGNILKLNSTDLLCHVQGEELTLSTSEINLIEFPANDLKAEDNQLTCLIGLEDGSILHASDAKLTKSGYLITLACGETSLFQPEEVIYLQPTTGSVTYLSDIKPIDYRHTPYLSLKWAYGNDQLPHGGSLVSNGLHYKKGISLHSASRIVYSTRQSDKRFQTTVALSDTSKKIENQSFRSVDVQILAIENNELVPHVEETLPGNDPDVINVDIDISKARAIVIVVDYGEGADVGDDVMFLDARFVNKLP